MSLYKKSTTTFMRISLTLCVVFLLHLIITPSAYTQGLNFRQTINKSHTSAKQTSPINHLGESYFISDFTGSELLTDIEINHVISRNLRDFQRLLSRVINTYVLAFLSFGILPYYIYSVFKRPEQQIPVIAISIGGHAPPRVVML